MRDTRAKPPHPRPTFDDVLHILRLPPARAARALRGTDVRGVWLLQEVIPVCHRPHGHQYREGRKAGLSPWLDLPD
jgi:hypothetical protein